MLLDSIFHIISHHHVKKLQVLASVTKHWCFASKLEVYRNSWDRASYRHSRLYTPVTSTV